MKTFEGTNVPIKSWCNNPEEGAVEQAKNLASLPFIFKHVALMPDTHQGYGMPIGGVIATEGVVIPNAVGVDIGCGMCAMKTSLDTMHITQEQIKAIFGGSNEYKGGIRGKIPVGFNHQSKKQPIELMPDTNELYCKVKNSIVGQEFTSAQKQLGTLGGGNHFIELQYDGNGDIYVMIHSGSRNLGYTVAKHYNQLAQELCTKWHSNIPVYKGEDGLAFLPLDSEEGKAYLAEMQYCVDFAYANRKLMMERVKEAILDVVECEFSLMINIAHNYASMENHFGKNVMVHRKGATLAREDTMGIIPGSQGTSSYIVKGKGNPESFMSCSHGAGRAMSRKKARENLSLEEEQKKLDDLHIIHAVRHKNNLDEASSAYKDIATVMIEQQDLVDILVELKPLGVIKG